MLLFPTFLQENMIVRCTRNSGGRTTTAALTRRPLLRMLSTSSPVSRSGSLKFSRSSNNSLKSTSGTNRTSLKSATTIRNSEHQRSYKEKIIKDKIDHKTEKHATICPKVEIIEPTSDMLEVPEKSCHKKAFMEATISIPTTINEESSRHNSLVPQPKLTPTPSMHAICEESHESSGTSSERDKNKIEMLTFAVIAKPCDQCKDYYFDTKDEANQILPEIIGYR